ncbi:MAG TPA: 1-deoxy-D-xylulose-5-phosphate synthase [Bacteroidales bacterium]|nr:1-deoxy-D-xylulose-5-phosphate synthase [Bacteroidales bacterium]
MNDTAGQILAGINSPDDLRRLDEKQLLQLCREIRDFILDEAALNPGHLGASLGTVELAVAVHYVFNTPYDKVIWDVGHQAYAHKILTGRRDNFSTNRKKGGISGFPKMEESEYDAFGTGHSSTSISAALGMAMASVLTEDNGRLHVAIIGDGAMTGGMAIEAMNNAGVSNANLLVILNDNGIAIDKNVGAIKEALADMISSKAYNKFKDKVWMLLGGGTRYGKNTRAIVKQISNAVKSTILRRSNLFEALNFRYFGPVDGNDVIRLTKMLRDLQRIQGPKLLHIVTKKGKGFDQAEIHQTTFHSPGTFDRKTGQLIKKDKEGPHPPKYQTVFGKTIIELARQNEKIVGITPAMPTGCSLNLMMEVMPERVFDVGIAEQHAVTFAAGLAAQGMHPFCNIYSTFAQRAYDQIIHDVAIQKLPVILCLDRGGLVGEDGATHHGAFDLAYLRAIPNLTIASPMNEEELRDMMYTAQTPGKGPFAIRYPRGRGVMPQWETPMKELQVGKGRKLMDGKDIAIITLGHVGNHASHASKTLENEGITVSHYDMRFLKPIDEALLHEAFQSHQYIITVEDGTIVGGLGSAVLEFQADNGYSKTIRRLGIPDRFISHGKQEELQHECGYDTDGIITAAREIMTARS